MASSKPSSKRKPLTITLSLVLFLIALLLFTIHHLRQLFLDDFRNGVPRPKPTKSIDNPEWFEVVARELGRGRMINVGYVNTDEEVRIEGTQAIKVDFDPVNEDEIRWAKLFPEWINEKNPSKCPHIPMPRFEDYRDLDVVVARVPCGEGGNWRSVFRLQVNLVVANLLVRSGREGNYKIGRPIFAVFIGPSGPMWEIFRCDDMLWHVGDAWVYKPQLVKIKQKVLMPVGSCQISPPFAQSGEELWRRQSDMSRNQSLYQPREAYVTVLHSSEEYVCGAIALAQSIIQSNSTKDLVLLADDHISPRSVDGLRLAGWKVKRIERIRSPNSRKNAYNEWNYSKLRIWQLTEYDKLMFIDSDLIVTKNVDEFFVHPQISAVGNSRYIFNSGLMLVEPSSCTFETLMNKRFLIKSYNGGDQGFLNEMFPWWHRLPAKLNKLKFFGSASPQDYVHQIVHDTYTVHYLGLKPWLCYKDYDCNWDKMGSRIFASDSANEKWWRVYDNMPKKLRQYCTLTPQMEVRIQNLRQKAKDGNFPDGHWKIEVQDERRNFVS